MKRESAIFAIDFDGTLAEHRYPDIGQLVPHGIPTCLALQQAGHCLILLTMRADDELQDAVLWCRQYGLTDWFGINENPEQHKWTSSPKVYAHHYIDDAALGCPLTQPHSGRRPYVNWVRVASRLRSMKLLPRAK